MGKNRLMAVISVVVLCIFLLFSAGQAMAKPIKFAITVNMDDAGGMAAATMKENVEQWSDGNMTMNLFPGSQLGGMREHYEACQSGAIEMVYVAASAASKFATEVGVLDLPFLFPTDYDEAWKVIDGDLTDLLSKKLEEKGFKLLGIAPYGFKAITTSKKQVKSLQDLAGMKIRIMPSKTLELTYLAWGAVPTPIEFAELYVALQQGVVDGEENGLTVIKAQRFNEVQDYLTVSKHALFCGLMVANKRWFDGLSDDERSIVLKAAEENIQQQRKFVAEEDENIIKYLGENGMEVYHLTEEQVEEFRKASIPVHEEFAKLSEENKVALDTVYDSLNK